MTEQDERKGERVIPAVPSKAIAFFPFQMGPLTLGTPALASAVEAALASDDKALAIFPQNDPSVDEPKEVDLFRTGTLSVVRTMTSVENTMHLVVQGLRRVELLEVVEDAPHLRVRVRDLADPADDSPEGSALERAVRALAERLSEYVEPPVKEALWRISGTENPTHLVYLLAGLLPVGFDREKVILAAPTRRLALELMHEYLSREVQVLDLRDEIASRAQNEIGKEQREYFLRHQIRAMQQELDGGKSPQDSELGELRRRLLDSDLPEVARKEVEKELGRLERTSQASPDYQVTRTYVDLVLELPWNRASEDALDLARARAILDEDHFGLEEVKDRILEHLAVMKLNPEAKSPILCFVGAPGVGKTSLGQSIARALGRTFERMSLGGLHDEAELRGHRRTYVGAMPGRILRAIRRAGVKNPLLMLDEVDKLGADFRGDPAAALMEILDPAQNGEFHDNYLDLPFDLSKVFFIATANTLDTIPGPLLDRMEVLRLAGYSEEEKVAIARRYLIGRQLRQAGLPPEQLVLPEETLGRLIRLYTREAGVRELERTLGRIARKLAVRLADGVPEPVTVAPTDLPELLGPERFASGERRAELAPGVAPGLAWTQAGGEILYVEAALLPAGKGLILTGQLGSVMQESAKTAQSYLWSRAGALGIDRSLLPDFGLHIHVPAGATPKDGPSAGVTIAVALASLYSCSPVRADTCMTGEITLSGLVLPVGGVKEKVLAAHRAGIHRILLPRENLKDVKELPEHVRQSLDFVAVDRIEDALAAAVPGLAERVDPARAAMYCEVAPAPKAHPLGVALEARGAGRSEGEG